MALPVKTDYVGLAGTGLELRSNSLGKTNTFLEKQGQNGDYVTDEVFGEVAAPSCEYAITAKVAKFTKDLGMIYNATAGQYALQSFTVSTSAGGEPTLSAEAVQIEAGTTSSPVSQALCTYTTTEIALSPEWHAQNFGAFTYTESDTLALQSCSFTAECAVNVTTVEGVPKASDATAGKETVSATFWTNDDAAPTIADVTGWTRSSPLTCTGSDGDMIVWTATWTKNLVSTEKA